MFDHDDDEDFDFNLDDVIPAKENEVVNSPPVNSSQSNKSFMTSTQSSSQQVTQEEWGSDEDLDISDIESSISTCSKDFTQNKKFEDNVKPPPQPQVCVRKFAGPAGLISRMKKNSERTDHNVSQSTYSKELCEVGVDSLYGWSKVMAILELDDIQKTVKFNIKWIKENFFPSSYVSIKVPFLVVGLKSIHSTKNDVNCIVQDQTGETRATIHQAVVEQHGKKIKAGTVLFLRRPAVLISGPCPHLVTVTKKSMIAIVSANAAGDHVMVRCVQYSRSDVKSWSCEEPECEELSVPCEDETPSPSYQGPRLFTSHSSKSPAYGSSNFKAPTSRTSSSAAIRSSASPLQRRPVAVATNSAASAPSSRVQVPTSKQQSTGRPTVPLQPPPSVPKVPTAIQNQPQLPPPPATDPTFIDQLFEGVDTDALFDDF